MKSKLNHVGLVTNDRERFEDFWCKGLGFEKVWEASIMPEKIKILFGIDGGATAIRYQKDEDVIEIHLFNKPVYGITQDFRKFGINHISLLVEDRDEFIKDLSSRVQYLEIRRFHDPSGWDNIFIRDYDGNWIELREDFT